MPEHVKENGKRGLGCTSLALVLTGLLLVSCSSGPRPGEVQRSWAASLRQLGINPVFPPREDVQVGDVYLRRGDPLQQELVSKQGFVPINLWVAAVDLRPEIIAFQARRWSLPDTVRAPASRADSHDLRKITDLPSFSLAHEGREPTRTENIFTGNGWNRLRQVAFPDFTSMTIRATSLQGLIPVQALAVAFGAAWEGAQQVDVKIPSASSTGLPFAQVVGRILRKRSPARGSFELQPGIIAPEYLGLLRQHLESWVEHGSDLSDAQRERLRRDHLLHLSVVTEVFYARTLDLAISRRNSLGGRAATSPTAGPKLGGRDPLQRAQILNAWLQKSGASTPGGAFTFLTVSDSSVTMRRTFQRPIAIGYRALSIAVDPRTGVVSAVGPQSDAVAVTTMGQARIRALLQAALREVIQQESGATRFALRIQQTDGGLSFVLHPRPQLPAWDVPKTRAQKQALVQRLRARSAELDDALNDIAGQTDATVRTLLEHLLAADFNISIRP